MSDSDTAHQVITFCDWCGIMICRRGSYTKEKKKKFIACKPECQKKLSKVFQSKEWLDLSEKDKDRFQYGVRTWYEKQEEVRMLRAKKYLAATKPSQMAKVKRIILKNPENMLLAHHVALKDDPEKLGTAFIENLMGWEVKDLKNAQHISVVKPE